MRESGCPKHGWSFYLFLLAVSLPALAADGPVTVSVDCSRTIEGPLNLWGCVNVSRRAPPPVELCERIEREYGRPGITRCWLMLDQAWDYRTDTYRFNYEINKDYYEGDPNKKRYGVPGVTTGLHYYDYVDSVSAHSETVMMNIRRYEQEVLSGMLTLDKWKEVFKAAVLHYKQRCPNLRYIEVLNEPTAKNQSNLGNIERYYAFYRQAYQAINELNGELQPELPLLVGGNSGFRTREAIHLIGDFARDPSPGKKLDFLSFHHYWVANTPAEIGKWETEIDDALRRGSLPTDIPIFVTEIGYANKWKDDPTKNLWQAAGMTAFQYQARHAEDLQLFPWVQYHSPSQIAFVQFDNQLRMTPFGAAVKMLRMHKGEEVSAASSGLDKNGNGLGALATTDGNGLVVELWNLEQRSTGKQRADVSIVNLPKNLHVGNLRIRCYRIDSEHSNCLTLPHYPGGLEMVEQRTQPGGLELRLSTDLEPMALCLWTIEQEPRSTTLQAQPPKYRLADLEVKILAAAPGRYFGRCALERLADGSWFLVYHESGSHFKYEPTEPKPILSGVLHARFSADGGRVWSKEDHCLDGTPISGFPAYPPGAEPTSGSFEPGEPWTYLAPNGDLVVHSLKNNFNTRRWQGTWQTRSRDGGRTWSKFEKIDFEGIENDDFIWAIDDHFVCEDVIYMGAREVPLPEFWKGMRNLLIRSSDDGRTWQFVSCVTEKPGLTTEQGIEYLGNGTILCVLNSVDRQHTWQTYSRDSGRTWEPLRDIASQTKIWDRPRICTAAHLRGEPNWWQDRLILGASDQRTRPGKSMPRRNCLWLSPDAGENWQLFNLDDDTEDSGYGDMLYDTITKRYVAILYHGTVDEAVLKQYSFRIVEE